MKRYLLVTAVALLGVAQARALPPSNEKTLENATEVLDDLTTIPAKSIPAKLLADAQGVAIIPNVVKAGFVFGGRGGHGLVIAKDKDGNWGEPVFVNLGGASVGFQAGVQSTDVVLVFRSRKEPGPAPRREGQGHARCRRGDRSRSGRAQCNGRYGREDRSGDPVVLAQPGINSRACRSMRAVVQKGPTRTATRCPAPVPTTRRRPSCCGAKLIGLSKEKPVPVPPPVLGPPVPAPMP